MQRFDVLQCWLSRREQSVGYVKSVSHTEEQVTACIAWDDGDADCDVTLFSTLPTAEEQVSQRTALPCCCNTVIMLSDALSDAYD